MFSGASAKTIFCLSRWGSKQANWLSCAGLRSVWAESWNEAMILGTSGKTAGVSNLSRYALRTMFWLDVRV